VVHRRLIGGSSKVPRWLLEGSSVVARRFLGGCSKVPRWLLEGSSVVARRDGLWFLEGWSKDASYVNGIVPNPNKKKKKKEKEKRNFIFFFYFFIFLFFFLFFERMRCDAWMRCLDAMRIV
jgi:hypothetical protein